MGEMCMDGFMVAAVMFGPPCGECSSVENGGNGAGGAWHVFIVDGGLVYTTDNAHLGGGTVLWKVWVSLDE